jgi:hypothetical protein
MIKNFFQSLEAGGVEYLLISGQATVLYGAATFSEDIDLWVNPKMPMQGAFWPRCGRAERAITS